jgi:hypothetical protein
LRLGTVSSRIGAVRAGLVLLLLGCSIPAFGQRITTVGTTIDVVGGFENLPASGLPGDSSQMQEFYGLLPGINLTSTTARTTLGATYSYGWNRFGDDLPRTTSSHAASVSLSSRLSPRWNFNLSDYYSRTNDIYNFYALRGVEIVEDSLVFYFSPTATGQAFTTNTVAMNLDHDLSAKSTLSFNAAHSLGRYEIDDALPGLSDQNNVSGGMTYSRQINDRTSWNLAYTAAFYSFDKFNSALSNAVTVGLSSRLTRNTTLSLSIGPSHVKNLHFAVTNTSYQATASLSQTVKENYFHISLNQGNSTSTGVGSLSSSRSATLGFSRGFGRRVNVFASAAAFQGTGIVGNPLNSQGTSLTGNVGFLLAKNLSLQTGALYQRYTQPAPYSYTQKRVFVSLRYSQPNLLRTH